MNFESGPDRKPRASETLLGDTAESGPERIDCAVIELNGEHFTASNHLTALLEMQKKYPNWRKEGLHPKDGFLTTSGRFVDREEAFEIADQANQLGSGEKGGTRSLQSGSLD